MEEHDPLFKFHILNDEGKKAATRIATDFTSFLHALEANGCLVGREGSIVKTKLEEVCFFAKKSMANQTKYQAQ